MIKCCCSVVIKGATQEDAVLCTSDKTFALKLVETTNTLLLLPPQEVCAALLATGRVDSWALLLTDQQVLLLFNSSNSKSALR